MNSSDSADLPNAEVSVWYLKRGPDNLAVLVEIGQEFPWVDCRLSPGPDFECYRHLFTRSGGVWSGKERELHKAISSEGIYLCTRDGEKLRAFTLDVTNSGARLTFTEV